MIQIIGNPDKKEKEVHIWLDGDVEGNVFLIQDGITLIKFSPNGSQRRVEARRANVDRNLDDGGLLFFYP